MGIIASRIPVIPYLRYGKTQTHSFAGAPVFAYKEGYETPNYVGRKVAVVGGGNVAMDAARTALRWNLK